MKLNRKTSNLDERQERRLLEIEGKGFRIAFWGLLLVFLIEMTVTDDLSAFIGDFILLIVVSLYVGIACIREGIWGRGQSVHRRSCLCWSLLAALAATGLRLGSVWMRYHSLVSSSEIERVEAFLREKNYSVRRMDDKLLVGAGCTDGSELIKLLVSNGLSLTGIAPYRENLEERFIRAIKQEVVR